MFALLNWSSAGYMSGIYFSNSGLSMVNISSRYREVSLTRVGTSKIDSTLNSSVVRKLIQSTRVYTNTPKTTPLAQSRALPASRRGPRRQLENHPILLSLHFWHPTWPFSQRKLARRRTPCSEIQRVSLLEFGVVCIYFSLKMHLKGATNTTKPMKCICLQFGL